MKLFCMTFAGGTATFFNQLEKWLPSGIEVIKLEYSGHGTRHKEDFYNSFDELAEDMLRMIKNVIDNDDDYALMGYSMGSISVVEVLRKILQDEKMSKPSHVFIAAHEPHTKAELAGFSSGEMDDFVKERTIKFGAVPEKLINNKSFWRMYLPIYRADYGIIGRYEFEKLNLKSDVPTTVFYSETDTPIDEMRKWSDIFVGDCQFVEYSGNHFFIQNHSDEIAHVITEKLVK